MREIVFVIFIFISSLSFSQVSFTGYLVDSNHDKLKDVEVNLYQGDEKISTKKWSKSFDYNLELEKYYTLELVKKGFLSKKIAISTFEGEKRSESFLFVMELIENKNSINGID
tara:strand:- start:221 stop:559 length:339 start_codon:yes stop_codon:yes gene_type:complete